MKEESEYLELSKYEFGESLSVACAGCERCMHSLGLTGCEYTG